VLVGRGVVGFVGAPFGWLIFVLGSAILELVIVAKRDKLPRVDGLASEIRDIRDTEVKGLSLILSQVQYL
jgi:hypothetical protein